MLQEKDREEMNDQLENAGLEADVDMLHIASLLFRCECFCGIEQKMIKWPGGATWPLLISSAVKVRA